MKYTLDRLLDVQFIRLGVAARGVEHSEIVSRVLGSFPSLSLFPYFFLPHTPTNECFESKFLVKDFI